MERKAPSENGIKEEQVENSANKKDVLCRATGWIEMVSVKKECQNWDGDSLNCRHGYAERAERRQAMAEGLVEVDNNKVQKTKRNKENFWSCWCKF